MVTGGMVWVGHADFRIGAIAELARELEGDDPRDIRLKRQSLQVEHQLGVVAERLRHPHRAVQIGQKIVRGRGFGTLNLALDLPDAVEILVDPGAVGGPHRSLQTYDIVVERIEQAGPALERRAALGEASALAEEALEHEARMRFGGQRRRR